MTAIETDLARWALAYETRRYSSDKSTQVGVVISGLRLFGRDPIQAANAFPFYVQDLEYRHERPAKYRFIEHAERNAIYAAARYGFCTDGGTLYFASNVPGFPPCCDCARAIIQAGIKRIVGKVGDDDPRLWRPDWAESMAAGFSMLREANVSFDTIDVSQVMGGTTS